MLQDGLRGAADEAGFESEDDVADYITEARRQARQ
jgi:hypothetical protein